MTQTTGRALSPGSGLNLSQKAREVVRARFFHSLADASRLAILDALRGGELSAGEIAIATGLSPSNASKHLSCLKDSGLVEARQHWRHVHYRLAGEHVGHLLDETDLVLEVVAEQAAS